MTDRIQPTKDDTAKSRETAVGAIQLGGGSSEGWVIPAADDPGNLAEDNSDITQGNLNAFDKTSSGSSFDVTIDAGALVVGGAWAARDTSTTVTLSSSTNNQDVFAGIDIGASNTLIVGKSSAFDADDPKHKIWTFDTDGSGVTSSTNQRNLDDYRVAIGDVEDHASTHGSSGSDTIDAADLGGSSGTSGQVLETDGSASQWSDAPKNVPNWTEDDNSPTTVSGASNLSYTISGTYDQILIALHDIRGDSSTSTDLALTLDGVTTGYRHFNSDGSKTTTSGSVALIQSVTSTDMSMTGTILVAGRFSNSSCGITPNIGLEDPGAISGAATDVTSPVDSFKLEWGNGNISGAVEVFGRDLG